MILWIWICSYKSTNPLVLNWSYENILSQTNTIRGIHSDTINVVGWPTYDWNILKFSCLISSFLSCSSLKEVVYECQRNCNVWFFILRLRWSANKANHSASKWFIMVKNKFWGIYWNSYLYAYNQTYALLIYLDRLPPQPIR